MERGDTLPLFSDSGETYGLFEEFIQDSSFHDRLNSNDIREILTSPEEQSDESASIGLWNNLDSDVTDVILEDDHLKIENNIKIENDTYKIPKVVPVKKVLQIGDEVYVFEGEREAEVLPEEKNISLKLITNITNSPSPPPSALGVPSLSLQPWKGNYDFSIRVETATYSNSKWAFSAVLKKLFLKPFDAVPIEVKTLPWMVDAYVNITPVYTSSQHTSSPVNRCHNHKSLDQEKKLPFYEHIVQVDNPDAKYREDRSRYSVDIPLGVPVPGEATKLIYVKCGCWNTCTGGPNRKPFCLIFTLFNSLGEEIGRQILDLKVCACPVRDCGYSEKNFLLKKKHIAGGKAANKAKLPASKKTISSKGNKRVKVEAVHQNLEYIAVPVEVSSEVKKFVNRLMAEKFAKENNFSPPFPDL